MTDLSPITTPEELLAAAGRTQLPYWDALAVLAEHVRDIEGVTLNANVHGLPLEFFARDDVSTVRSNVNNGEVYLSANIDIGGRSFAIFSRHFPTEAQSE